MIERLVTSRGWRFGNIGFSASVLGFSLGQLVQGGSGFWIVAAVLNGSCLALWLFVPPWRDIGKDR